MQDIDLSRGHRLDRDEGNYLAPERRVLNQSFSEAVGVAGANNNSSTIMTDAGEGDQEGGCDFFSFWSVVLKKGF